MAFDEGFLEPGARDVRYDRERRTDGEYELTHRYKDETIRVVAVTEGEFEGFDAYDGGTFDVVLVSPSFDRGLKTNPDHRAVETTSRAVRALALEARTALSAEGTLLVHHAPAVLPAVGHALSERGHRFRYWISLERPPADRGAIRHGHEGVLLYFMDGQNFHYDRIREPHRRCVVCGDFRSDWGGKKENMHEDGYVVSDVWTDVSFAGYGENTRLPVKAVDRLLDLVTADGFRVLFAPFEGDLAT